MERSLNFKEWTTKDVIDEIKESIGPHTCMKIFRNCILDEGNLIVSDSFINPSGETSRTLILDSPLKITDTVTISTENDGSFEGLLIVEAASNDNQDVIGYIVSEPKLMAAPKTSADADSPTKRLAGQYFRIAAVEIDKRIKSIEEKQ